MKSEAVPFVARQKVYWKKVISLVVTKDAILELGAHAGYGS